MRTFVLFIQGYINQIRARAAYYELKAGKAKQQKTRVLPLVSSAIITNFK
ncbi:hypothetical protein [Anabaena sp. 4-3]|nr:hypothetical protein [Anabaena sp. 4-3]